MDIKLMLDYTRWADARTLDAAAKLTEEQYARDLASSHRSLRDTLVHIVWVQWLYLERWRGTSPSAAWAPADWPRVEPLRSRGSEVADGIAAFLAKADPAREVAYANLKGERLSFPLWQLALHVANHSTYHRGQAATLLRQLGQEPPATDLHVFLRASPR